jgi:hypothetical protein
LFEIPWFTLRGIAEWAFRFTENQITETEFYLDAMRSKAVPRDTKEHVALLFRTFRSCYIAEFSGRKYDVIKLQLAGWMRPVKI